MRLWHSPIQLTPQLGLCRWFSMGRMIYAISITKNSFIASLRYNEYRRHVRALQWRINRNSTATKVWWNKLKLNLCVNIFLFQILRQSAQSITGARARRLRKGLLGLHRVILSLSLSRRPYSSLSHSPYQHSLWLHYLLGYSYILPFARMQL